MRLFPLAYAAALLPLLTIHLSFFWAASLGQVDWCFPYWHSCTSISATGRLPPSYHLFKALMIPAAVLLAFYWCLCASWLAGLGSTKVKARRWVMGLGLVSSAGLILYSVMLGAIGEGYQLQRRMGVVTFFGFCYLAQLLITWLLFSLDALRAVQERALRGLQSVSLTILVVGLLSIVLSAAVPDIYRHMDNGFEWTFTLLLCVHALIVAELWRRTAFRAGFVADRGL